MDRVRSNERGLRDRRERGAPGNDNMLVLTRKKDQVIQIGDDIRVVVVGIVGDRVKLGISAPQSVPVDREEIAKRKAVEGRKSQPAPVPRSPLLGSMLAVG